MAISHGLTTSLFQSLQQAGAERGMEELRQRLFSLHLAPRTEQNSKREHKTCSLYTCLPTLACFLSAPPSSPLFIVPTVEKRWMTQKETTQRSSDFGWEKSFWPCFTSITFHHHTIHRCTRCSLYSASTVSTSCSVP